MVGVDEISFWGFGLFPGAISLIWPPPCNSDHQGYYMFSRGFLLTFTFHCYREGAISKLYLSFRECKGFFSFFKPDSLMATHVFERVVSIG